MKSVNCYRTHGRRFLLPLRAGTQPSVCHTQCPKRDANVRTPLWRTWTHENGRHRAGHRAPCGDTRYSDRALRHCDRLIQIDVLDDVEELDAFLHRPLERLAARDQMCSGTLPVTRALATHRAAFPRRLCHIDKVKLPSGPFTMSTQRESKSMPSSTTIPCPLRSHSTPCEQSSENILATFTRKA